MDTDNSDSVLLSDFNTYLTTLSSLSDAKSDLEHYLSCPTEKWYRDCPEFNRLFDMITKLTDSVLRSIEENKFTVYESEILKLNINNLLIFINSLE